MDKLQRFKEILQVANQDVASKKEVVALFSKIISAIKEIQNKLKQDVDYSTNSCLKAYKTLENELYDTEKRLTLIIEKAKLDSKDEAYKQLKEEVLKLEKTIKNIPEFDPNNLIRDFDSKLSDSIKSLKEDIGKWKQLTGIEVRDLLTDLPDDEKLSIEAIKDLRKELDEIRQIRSQSFVGGSIVGRDIVKDIDISSQLDGNTKTFNIPGVWNVILVNLSSFPYGSLRKNIDFTFTATTITFTSAIDAPTQLASGQSCVLTVVSQ